MLTWKGGDYADVREFDTISIWYSDKSKGRRNIWLLRQWLRMISWRQITWSLADPIGQESFFLFSISLTRLSRSILPADITWTDFMDSVLSNCSNKQKHFLQILKLAVRLHRLNMQGFQVFPRTRMRIIWSLSFKSPSLRHSLYIHMAKIGKKGYLNFLFRLILTILFSSKYLSLSKCFLVVLAVLRLFLLIPLETFVNKCTYVNNIWDPLKM